MDEIEAMKLISDALQELKPEERSRVLGWAQSKYGSSAPSSCRASAQSGNTEPARSSPNGAPPRAKNSKKAKTVISMDKGLNLSPQGKQSAVEFAKAKAPSNSKEKCVAAVYYLRDIIELEQVSARGVFTFFKTVQWVAPANLKNMLQQAGTAGWLDTSDSDDIKLTSLGENLVEHDLPPQPKKL